MKKRTHLLFWILVIFVITQISWWIYFQYRQNQQASQLVRNSLRLKAQLVQIEIQKLVEDELEKVASGEVPISIVSLHGLEHPLFSKNIPSTTFIYHQGRDYWHGPDSKYYEVHLNEKRLSNLVSDRWPGFSIEFNREARNLEQSTRFILPFRLVTRSAFEQSTLSEISGSWRMFLSEGIFFYIVILVGVGYMYRTMRKEMALEIRQRDFILNVTHELKSPIASAKLYLETLLRHDVSKQKSESFIRNSLVDLERLGRLIENILSIARFEQSPPTANESICLSEALEEKIHVYRSRYRNIDIKFEGEIEPNIYLNINPDDLDTVVDNLVDNSVKFRSDQPVLELKLYSSDETVTLEATDNGVGVAPGDLTHIFERFYRGSKSSSVKGAGLGLYLCKMIVSQYSGTIRALSKNSGFSVVIDFPVNT